MKPFESYLVSFQEFLKEHNCSERTVETYAYHACKFVQFLEKHYPRIQSSEKVTREIVGDYQKYLSGYRDRTGRPLSSRTQILKLRILRSFFTFLVSQDLILKNPAASILLPREEQRLIRNTLSQKEVLEMLHALSGNDPACIRNRAIVELFYGCGLRTTELCQLKVQDVDFQEQTVAILKGKGGKPRIVPIGQYAAYYLQRYLDKGRKYMLKGKREDRVLSARMRDCARFPAARGSARWPWRRDASGRLCRWELPCAVGPGKPAFDVLGNFGSMFFCVG